MSDWSYNGPEYDSGWNDGYDRGFTDGIKEFIKMNTAISAIFIAYADACHDSDKVYTNVLKDILKHATDLNPLIPD